MAEPLIKAFKGLRYNSERVDDISACVCPPYDVITDPSLYYGRSPCNAVRLELPMAREGLDPYGAARKTLDRWIADRTLSFDDEDSVYVYEQEFSIHDAHLRRMGFIPLVRLDRKRILTHEQTQESAKKDRQMLTEALKTFTSLIFAMYEDGSDEIGGLLEGAKKEKLYDFVDDQSNRNRFYRMTDTTEMARLTFLMNEKNLYIADGHHRLSVSFNLGLPYVAVYLTDMHSSGVSILPYHRLVKFARPRAIKEILAPLEPYFDRSEAPVERGPALDRLIAGISSSRGSSFLLYGAGEKPSLHVFRQKQAIPFDTDADETVRRLRVNVVHSGVLKFLLGVEDGEISFVKDPDEAIQRVDSRASDYAFFVPATTVEEVKAIAEGGLCMPPKSTYFYPKVLTGLVFHKYG
jgi:uncharacterized protein (DUF1015 family)